MPKLEMRDLIVFIPGITGSVLQRYGEDLWAPSAQAVWGALLSAGQSLQYLKLDGDDAQLDDLGDGIQATRLVPEIHLIPGLWRIEGYSRITRMIRETFDVRQGVIDAQDDKPANYFEFPYDWRRDNRVHARRLQRLVDHRLTQWRRSTPFPKAKVIFIVHSMGGLIARHYLELLGGWRDCKALITFGTPFRGSLNALNSLANGPNVSFVDISDVLRSWTSVYQLLPTYPVMNTADGSRCITEVGTLPNVSQTLVKDAYAFHTAIEKAVSVNQASAEYRQSYKILPLVGTRQQTFQSARLTAGRLVVEVPVPQGLAPEIGDGDGTVPRFSAIPIELTHEYRETFVPERHSSLHGSPRLLDDLRDRLIQMQSEFDFARAFVAAPALDKRVAISLDIGDLYLATESVYLHVRLLNAADESVYGPLHATLQRAGDRANVRYEFARSSTGWTLALGSLPSGLYRVTVRTRAIGARAPLPVHEVFEVVSV